MSQHVQSLLATSPVTIQISALNAVSACIAATLG